MAAARKKKAPPVRKTAPKKKSNAGRKSKDTPESRELFFKAITVGNTRRAACLYAGFGEDALARYLKKEDFAALLKKAEGEAEVRNVAIIQNAAKRTWQAAAWWLERKVPESWARIERFEHSGPGGTPVSVNVYLPDNGRDPGLKGGEGDG